jgi:hypothetical protein
MRAFRGQAWQDGPVANSKPHFRGSSPHISRHSVFFSTSPFNDSDLGTLFTTQTVEHGSEQYIYPVLTSSIGQGATGATACCFYGAAAAMASVRGTSKPLRWPRRYCECDMGHWRERLRRLHSDGAGVANVERELRTGAQLCVGGYQSDKFPVHAEESAGRACAERLLSGSP